MGGKEIIKSKWKRWEKGMNPFSHLEKKE
jgi:hypothetical protein